ncbi:MAG: PQQ-binding-like beta-propeller repeat protein [bacterium]|nr:PQQ-binding-like beta-propeller repeat protein [bacterium]
MRRFGVTHLFLAAAVLGIACLAGAQENWPQWRGPGNNGISTSTGLPKEWDETKNIIWKVPMPAWSGSTPVIWGDQIFVTSPSKSVTPPAEGGRDPGGSELLLLCISKADGSVLWERQLDDGNKLGMKQNDSSPSPITDGKHVWAVTGKGTITALTMDGTSVWSRNLQEDYGKFGLQFGYASSPVLHDGMIIVQVLHGYFTDDPSYLAAFDALTGEPRWHHIRPTDAVRESPDSYTTPALLHHDGSVQLVVLGGDYVTGHDPKTGAEVWRAAGINPKGNELFRTIASPVAVDGMIYAPTRKKPLLALRAGGTGDVTESHLAWKWDRPNGTDVPTPVCDGTLFYMVEDRGAVTCLDAKTGEVVWGPERPTRGTVSASPLLADGKLYMTNEDGVTTVLAAGRKFKVLATNTLEDEYTLSSLLVSGKHLYLRTSTHLYCIGKR